MKLYSHYVLTFASLQYSYSFVVLYPTIFSPFYIPTEDLGSVGKFDWKNIEEYE